MQAKDIDNPFVLVVEDHEVTAFHTCEVLRKAGFIPTLAESLTEACAITSIAFGAIFLDLLLPETNHSNLSKSVISIRERFPRTTLIVLSAYLPEANVMELLRLGADFCLKKPLTSANVRSVITRASELNHGQVHRIAERLDAALA